MLFGDLLFLLTSSIINTAWTAPIGAIIGNIVDAVWALLGLP